MSAARRVTGPHLAIRDRLLTEMIEQQHDKLLRLARRIVPTSPGDLRNPQDFLQLSRDPVFNYEDGILAGLRSATSPCARNCEAGARTGAASNRRRGYMPAAG